MFSLDSFLIINKLKFLKRKKNAVNFQQRPFSGEYFYLSKIQSTKFQRRSEERVQYVNEDLSSD